MLQPASTLLGLASLRIPAAAAAAAEVMERRRSGGNGGGGVGAGSGQVEITDEDNNINILEQIRNDLNYYLNNSLAELGAMANNKGDDVGVGVGVGGVGDGGRHGPHEGLLINASVSAEHVTDRFYRHGAVMSVVYTVAYVLVFFCGLIGNILVVSVVVRSPRMRTVTNFFIGKHARTRATPTCYTYI